MVSIRFRSRRNLVNAIVWGGAAPISGVHKERLVAWGYGGVRERGDDGGFDKHVINSHLGWKGVGGGYGGCDITAISTQSRRNLNAIVWGDAQ